jgi:hypothetical protein
VQLRRTLLAFVLVLAAVSLGAALTAPREEEDDSEPPARPAPRTRTPGAVTVAFRQPVEGGPPVRDVRTGAHVVLRVSARTAGEVEVTGLGLNQSVTPAAPAVFDLLATRAGRYDVVLVPLTGPERIKLGTLVVG